MDPGGYFDSVFHILSVLKAGLFEMANYYKEVLLVVILVILWLIFAYGNRFDDWKRTALRALIAIVVGWVVILITTLAITEIDLALATTIEEKMEISRGDGGRHTGALLLGWAYASVPVGLMWMIHRIIKWLKLRKVAV